MRAAMPVVELSRFYEVHVLSLSRVGKAPGYEIFPNRHNRDPEASGQQ